MPEAVKDRCVKSNEYIFLMSLKPRYYFDYEAIQEKAVYVGDNRGARNDSRRDEPLAASMAAESQPTKEFRNKRDVWSIIPHNLVKHILLSFPKKFQNFA